jgi:hypothetical protein
LLRRPNLRQIDVGEAPLGRLIPAEALSAPSGNYRQPRRRRCLRGRPPPSADITAPVDAAAAHALAPDTADYNQARSLEASRRHAETLSRLRQTLKADRNR